ncbi:MAG: dTMP kinase [bacterium]
MTEPILTETATQRAPCKFPTDFVFATLEQAGVRYALLRGYDELLNAPADVEIDLLVHRDDLLLLARTVAGLGFVETPAWGHAPHRFFVAFSTELGVWIKLDVVTELYYGHPFRHLRLKLVGACLRQRRHEDVYLLSEEHEFLTLLLHCLLDKGRFDEKHRLRLRQLAARLREDLHLRARLGNLVQKFLSPAIDWPFIAKVLESDVWQELLHHRTALAHHLLRRARLSCVTKIITTSLARRLRPVFFMLRRHGVATVLLAPDGAGKSTLAKSLMRDKHLRARLVYMGTNIEARTVGLPLTPVLSRKLKEINQSNQRKTAMGLIIRCVNLVNTLAEHWYRCLYARYQLLRGRFVIFDRFIYDAWIQKRQKSGWKRLRRWLFDVACPEPDLVVLLDAPGEVLYARKQEHSSEWIDQQRAGYHKLSDSLPQMVIVDASQSAEAVRKEVTGLIWRRYGHGAMK